MIGDADPWIGTSFITLAVVCASYAVFAAGHLLRPRGGGARLPHLGPRWRAGGSPDRRAARDRGAELDASGARWPVLPGPRAGRHRRPLRAPRLRVSGGGSSVAARRPSRGIACCTPSGERELAVSPASAGVQPALAHVIRALDVTGLTVAAPDGTVVAAEGTPPASDLVMPIPLMDGGELVGEMRVGETLSGAPLDARDLRLLELSASYVASALRTGRREDEQATELARLADARATVDSHAAALHAALVERSDVAPGRARLRPGPAAHGACRDAHRALGRRQGRQPPGAGPVRVPVRPRRAGRGQGRGAGAHLARRRPRARGPRVPPDDGGPARDPGPGQAAGWGRGDPVRQRPLPARRVGRRLVGRGRVPRDARRRRRCGRTRPDPVPRGGAPALPGRVPRRLPLLRRQRLRRGAPGPAAQPVRRSRRSRSGRPTSRAGTGCRPPPPSGRP